MDYNKYKIGEPGPMDGKVKEIIFRSNNFMVYIDEAETIQWSTTTNGDLDESFGDIQNKISFWESVCNKIFTKKDSYEYKCLLAEAYARILDNKNVTFANQIIEQTVYRIEKQGKEILKQSYILSSLKCTILILITIFIIVITKPHIIPYLTTDKYEVIITSLFGGVGAFVFTILRLKKYHPEIVLTKEIHKIDGALRIFYGLIAGLIIAICIKSNLLLGFIEKMDKTIYLNSFLGIIAGASEVLIPNLIKQVEEKTN